jgi:hypothetical protein
VIHHALLGCSTGWARERDESRPYEDDSALLLITKITSYILPDRSGPLTLAAGVTTEVARGRKLTQLMAYHILCDIDWHMGLAIVDTDGHAHHLGEDRRSTRPGLDNPAISAPHHSQDFLPE